MPVSRGAKSLEGYCIGCREYFLGRGAGVVSCGDGPSVECLYVDAENTATTTDTGTMLERRDHFLVLLCQARCIHRKWVLIGVPSLSRYISFCWNNKNEAPSGPACIGRGQAR